MASRKYHPDMTRAEEAALLAHLHSEERQYAESHAYTEAEFDRWVRKHTEVLTKRTDFPKLGYIISRLNQEGIPSVLHGESWHAPILRVSKHYESQAWDILSEKFEGSRKDIDNLDDDDPRFARYARVRPDPELWEG